jgi:hypothetical protein
VTELLTSSLHQVGTTTGQADHQRGENRQTPFRLATLSRLIDPAPRGTALPTAIRSFTRGPLSAAANTDRPRALASEDNDTLPSRYRAAGDPPLRDQCTSRASAELQADAAIPYNRQRSGSPGTPARAAVDDHPTIVCRHYRPVTATEQTDIVRAKSRKAHGDCRQVRPIERPGRPAVFVGRIADPGDG